MTQLYIANLIIDFMIKTEKKKASTFSIPVEPEIDPMTGNPVEDGSKDSVTGNPIEEENLYRVKVHVKGLPNILQEMGSNPNVLQIEGKIVATWNNKKKKWENNKILPEELLRYQVEATATYIDPESGFKQACHFMLLPMIDASRPRVAKRLAQRLGSEIKGNLRF